VHARINTVGCVSSGKKRSDCGIISSVISSDERSSWVVGVDDYLAEQRHHQQQNINTQWFSLIPISQKMGGGDFPLTNASFSTEKATSACSLSFIMAFKTNVKGVSMSCLNFRLGSNGKKHNSKSSSKEDY
jgi:hypothetical protein